MKTCAPKSSVLPAETPTGTTPFPWLLTVPPAAVSVKFSVALTPPTVMDAPVPVPFGAAKLATLPP